MPKTLDIDWEIIRNTYVYSPKKISLARLAKVVKSKGIKVSQGAIGNKAAKENWAGQRDSYHEKVNQAVEKRMTSSIIKRRLKNLKMVNAVKTLGVRNLIDKLKEKELYISVHDLDKLMRLEEFLSGDPDSRSERTIISKKPLKDLSQEELDELLNQIPEGEFEVLDD